LLLIWRVQIRRHWTWNKDKAGLALMNILKGKKNIIEQTEGLTLSIGENEAQRSFSGDTIEGLRHLITRLQQRGGLPKRLSMVAALRKEGVSYLSQALATIIAHDLDRQVCLVDLNFWWSDECFQSNQDQPSMVQILNGEFRLEDAIRHTCFPNLHILPAGTVPRQKRPALAKSNELTEFINELGLFYDHLLLDVPAILATTESASLASLGNAACLVIKQGVTQVGEVSLALDEIEHMELVGSVLNHVRISTPQPILRLLTYW
jgi:Mrp family chromosome partitioning ATPase